MPQNKEYLFYWPLLLKVYVLLLSQNTCQVTWTKWHGFLILHINWEKNEKEKSNDIIILEKFSGCFNGEFEVLIINFLFLVLREMRIFVNLELAIL